MNFAIYDSRQLWFDSEFDFKTYGIDFNSKYTFEYFIEATTEGNLKFYLLLRIVIWDMDTISNIQGINFAPSFKGPPDAYGLTLDKSGTGDKTYMPAADFHKEKFQV